MRAHINYLHEADPRTPINTTNANANAPKNNTPSRVSATTASTSSTVNGEYSSKEDYQKSGDRSIVNASNSKQDIDKYLSTLLKGLNEYKTRAGLIFSAKANATVEISKNYLDLIRAHVNDYIGQQNNIADNSVQKPGTNYTNNQQANTNQNKK